MGASYNQPLKEISSKKFDEVLYPEKTAILLSTFEDENIFDFSYPDQLTFLTGMNMEIPFIVDPDAYTF